MHTLIIVVRDIAQIIILLVTRNYVLFLAITIGTTVIKNIVLSKKANKLYPFIVARNSSKKKGVNVSDITTNIKSIFIYKIGTIVMNNTDNILISMIVGTVYVGFYSNYSMIVMAVKTFIGVLIQAIFSSVGNLNAKGDKEKSYRIFNVLLLFFHWLSAVCALGFLLVFNDFITIWVGYRYVLGVDVVFAIVLNFYVQNIVNPVWIYRETMGMFKDIKYVMLVAAMINLIFSVLLGFRWGLAGIIISTVIGRILTTVWYEPKLLYRLIFERPVKHYWFKQIRYMISSAFATYVSIVLTRDLPLSLPFIFVKLFVAFILVSGIFLIVEYRSIEFKTLLGYIPISGKISLPGKKSGGV